MSGLKRNYNVLIVGGGIVGLTVARELHRRGEKSIAILEKESALGQHASGRNSGVLHAGFYYSAESLKAKLCAEGARRMMDYASEKGIRFEKTGKVVVAATPEAVPAMDDLLKRAKANQIVLKRIDLKELHELEPEAFSVESALYSPNTAVIDSKGVLKSLYADLTGAGVHILKEQEVVAIDEKTQTVHTKTDEFGYGHLINSAGLHADRIAHMVGVGENYCILPFKGVYRKLTADAAKRFRTLIYPVPDLRVPFLGVHTTRNIDGEVYLGPTAIPAFGRENYGIMSGVEFLGGAQIATRLLRMIGKNTQGMRRLVAEEMGRYSTRGFLKAAQAVAPNLSKKDMLDTGKVGLRAQLFDKKTAKLEMDFVIADGPQSTHVLNAISPAFSASMAFSDMIADRVFK